MDNGGPGGGTESTSDKDPLVTWGEGKTGASVSVGSNAFRCCPNLGSWPESATRRPFSADRTRKRGRIRRREARLRVAEWGGDRARAGERRIYVSNSTSFVSQIDNAKKR